MSEKKDILTAAQRKKYLKKYGTSCPFCGSKDIEGQSIDIDVGEATQEVICCKCNKGWYDVYTLTGVESY